VSMRGSEVVRDSSFEDDLAALRGMYPEIDRVVSELVDVLLLDYDLPEIPVEVKTLQQVYAVLLDYPPLGPSGPQRFLVTYHATDPTPSPQTPYRTYTLLRITERRA
jgi:hypothetical protein